jgi:hypothetical protein
LRLFVVHHQQAAFPAQQEFLDAAEFFLQASLLIGLFR